MRDDALPMGRLVLAGMAVVATVALAIGVVLAMLAYRRVPVGGLAIDPPAPPGHGLPMLQSAPQPDLASYQADKLQLLQAAGAASGVPHVSIETAMALRTASAAQGASR